MFEKSVRWYDRLYAWKDYAAESAYVRSVLQEHQTSEGRRLLDVACGTGLHLAHLRETHEVEGLDANDEMLELARRRCPGVPFYRGDMRAFDLGRTFDAVTCLFSSIGYLRTVEELVSTFRSFARHLVSGGVAVVEPWFPPDRIDPTYVGMTVVEDPDLKICRMNSNRFDGRVSVLDMHHLVGTPQGTEHFVERHELTSFTPEEVGAALREAGLDAVYDPKGFGSRGLHVGRRR